MNCPKCNVENSKTSRFCAECGTKLLMPGEVNASSTETISLIHRELTVGTVFFGRFHIIEEMGKGGMGRVYRTLDKRINEEIAIKLLRPEISSNKETIDRFSNELRMARSITHRNVCKMYELMEAEGNYFITMEYVRGQDLKRLIRQTGQLTIRKAVAIAHQVSDALTEAHKLGIIHRDLKPSNIMIDREGNAKIMDFGIARSLAGKSLTQTGVIMGTPEYMSPEQLEGKDIDERSDIYALGAIIYEMITGRIPFEGETPISIALKQKTGIPPSLKNFNPSVPDQLNQLVLKCLEKEKDKRYQKADQVLSDLSAMEDNLPETPAAAPKRTPLTSREITVSFKFKKLLYPALVLFLAAIIIAGISYVNRRGLPGKSIPAAPPTEVQGKPEPQASNEDKNKQEEFDKYMLAASRALADKNHELARENVDAALKIRPEAAAALTLKDDIQEAVRAGQREAQKATEAGKDDLAFSAAKSHDTLAAYEGYLKAYPSGKHVHEAQQALARLRTPVAPPVKEKAAPDEKLLEKTRIAASQQFSDRAIGSELLVEVKGVRFPLVWIPPGQFRMGSSDGPPEQRPRRLVKISKGFWMGKYEVTQGLWMAVMDGGNPSYFKKGPEYPVESVTWEDCQEFIRKLNELSKKTFRLPTEAEWEYACRAGTDLEISGPLDEFGWLKMNSENSSHPVGLKKPNNIGLHDMLGNLWEWCADWFGPYEGLFDTDPAGPPSGEYRVIRGGSWNLQPELVVAALRNSFSPGMKYFYIGLRVVLEE